MIARFLGAFQFLTILPIRRPTESPGACAIFFPLVGAVLGAAGGLLFSAAKELVTVPLAALLVLAFWAVVTGGLHEDGFADVADAFRADRPRERILLILKDSRIGAHGALALILISIVRWQSLSSLAADRPVLALAAVMAVSRGSIAALAWIWPPAGGGLGFEFSRSLTSAGAIAAIIQGIFWAYFSGSGTLLIWGASLVVIISGVYCTRRIGGITGDCLGATCLLAETQGLLLFSCQRCM